MNGHARRERHDPPIVLHDNGSVCIELVGDRDEDDGPGWLEEASLVFAGPMWDAVDKRLVELCGEEPDLHGNGGRLDSGVVIGGVQASH